MAKSKDLVPSEGEVQFYLTIREISVSFDVEQETIIEIVNEGIVPLQKNQENELLFDNDAYHRIRTVLQLHRDLGVNIAGAALVLELLNEIDALHNRILTTKT